MGLLEKAGNIQTEDTPPATKVVQQPEAVPQPAPVTEAKPVKKAKPAKKAKPKKVREKKTKTPRVKKEMPDGFESATRGQRIIRRVVDFAVSYGWSVPLIGISAWGSDIDPTLIILLGIGLMSFNLWFMPSYAGKRTVGNWISRTRYVNSRADPPIWVYILLKGLTTIFVILGVFALFVIVGNKSIGEGTFEQIFNVIALLLLFPPLIDFSMYKMRGDLGLWDTVFGGVWLVRTTKSTGTKGWLKRLESISDWTESKGLLDDQEETSS